MSDKPTCILVMGMARSGTSMTAGILHNLGIDMGPTIAGNLFNRKGYYEDMEFVNLHCGVIGTTHMDYIKKIQDYDEGLPAEWLEYYGTLIRKRETSQLWGLKDPRLFFFIGDFLDLLGSNLKVIRVTRDPQAIAKSLKRYYAGWRVPDDERLKYLVGQWIRLRDKAIAKTKSKREGCITISYEQAVRRPQKTVEQIADFVDIPVTPAALEFIDPNLDHSKR